MRRAYCCMARTISRGRTLARVIYSATFPDSTRDIVYSHSSKSEPGGRSLLARHRSSAPQECPDGKGPALLQTSPFIFSVLNTLLCGTCCALAHSVTSVWQPITLRFRARYVRRGDLAAYSTSHQYKRQNDTGPHYSLEFVMGPVEVSRTFHSSACFPRAQSVSRTHLHLTSS